MSVANKTKERLGVECAVKHSVVLSQTHQQCQVLEVMEQE